VSIALRLGLAEQALITDPDRVPELIKDARVGAEEAMRELREVLRTMYPPILADRGLAGAISALVARSPVATSLEVAELGQVPAPVEAAAYFVVAEALTNVAKHSEASRAGVRLSRNGAMLVVVVEDDGVGGAGPDGGTGIDGMRRRVAALDGTFLVHSPPGGPTRVAVEVPCAS
jgi:signal transduction histidine kinase